MYSNPLRDAVLGAMGKTPATPGRYRQDDQDYAQRADPATAGALAALTGVVLGWVLSQDQGNDQAPQSKNPYRGQTTRKQPQGWTVEDLEGYLLHNHKGNPKADRLLRDLAKLPPGAPADRQLLADYLN